MASLFSKMKNPNLLDWGLFALNYFIIYLYHIKRPAYQAPLISYERIIASATSFMVRRLFMLTFLRSS